MKTLQKWLKDKCNKNYSLDELSNLTWLWLNNNNLTSIPPELGQLSNLEGLSLYNNNLTSLPPELGHLSNLKWLYLYNNNLFVNKKHVQLIEMLKKHEVSFTIAQDTLLTDLLL